MELAGASLAQCSLGKLAGNSENLEQSQKLQATWWMATLFEGCLQWPPLWPPLANRANLANWQETLKSSKSFESSQFEILKWYQILAIFPARKWIQFDQPTFNNLPVLTTLKEKKKRSTLIALPLF